MYKKCVYEQFFFEGATVNGEAYLDMLENCLMDYLHEEESKNFIFQEDGSPHHGSLRVRQYLNPICLTNELDILEEVIAVSGDGHLGFQVSLHALLVLGLCKKVGLHTY